MTETVPPSTGSRRTRASTTLRADPRPNAATRIQRTPFVSPMGSPSSSSGSSAIQTSTTGTSTPAGSAGAAPVSQSTQLGVSGAVPYRAAVAPWSAAVSAAGSTLPPPGQDGGSAAGSRHAVPAGVAPASAVLQAGVARRPATAQASPASAAWRTSWTRWWFASIAVSTEVRSSSAPPSPATSAVIMRVTTSAAPRSVIARPRGCGA